MKAILATSAFAAVIAIGSPASAQSYAQDFQSFHQPGLGAFAQEQRSPIVVRPRRDLSRVPQTSDGRVHSSNPANDVYDTQGHYIGSDPDPFIRNDLMRVPPERDE